MNRENLKLEVLWICLQSAFYLPILAAAIIVVVNIYAAFHVRETRQAQESTQIVQTESVEQRETLYIEETRLSGADICFAEMEKTQADTGYLITDEMRMVAQLVQAEAGNQDLTGKRLVADVVLNRVDSERFPNTVEEVIYQKKPVQFSVTVNGAFKKAATEISEECFEAVRMEWEQETRLDKNVMFFNSVHENGKNPFKHGDHWFSY